MPAAAQGVLKPMTLLSKTMPPGRRFWEPASLEFVSFCGAADGPALLVASANSQVALHHITAAVRMCACCCHMSLAVMLEHGAQRRPKRTQIDRVR